METENNVVWQDDGQEAVQGDQHDQQEEEQDTDDYCSDLENNTQGTAGGPGGRDRTLAVKVEKTLENNFFSVNFFFAYIF